MVKENKVWKVVPHYFQNCLLGARTTLTKGAEKDCLLILTLLDYFLKYQQNISLITVIARSPMQCHHFTIDALTVF